MMLLEDSLHQYLILISEDADLSEPLGIQKYEPPMAACLRGVAKGNFPSFIPKTDEERIQNLYKKYVEWMNDSFWEITEKLDGSSMTVYYKDGVVGVCSRNLDLKETEGNSFWEAANKYGLREKMLDRGWNIAFQGELIGEGIQGNPYKLQGRDFYIFNVFDIDRQTYVVPSYRYAFVKAFGLKHVPIICESAHLTNSAAEVLAGAEGKSALNATTEREGLVYKCHIDDKSFKAISNKFLLKGGE